MDTEGELDRQEDGWMDGW